MLLLSREEKHFVPSSDTKNYNGIDLIKFLCAILVFIIHIPPFHGEVSKFAEYVNFGLQHFACRIAVPFYFVSSGFFLFKKMPLYELDKDIIKVYCYKILRLLGVWHVLLFVGGTGHLWYLGATVIAIILLSLCFHFRIKLGYIYVIACVLYLIGLFGDSYYGIIAPLQNIAIFNLLFKGYKLAFYTTRNGVFMGFIFVLMGATFSNRKIILRTRTALIGFVVSMLCLFAEVFLLKYNDIPIEYNMYVFLLPATFFLFSLAASIELKDRFIYRHLRNIGMVIYFSHLLVNKFTLLAASVVDKYCSIGLVRYQFVLSLSFTLLIAIFADWLSHKDKFKWVNWILT
jgi:serine/alanine racemase